MRWAAVVVIVSGCGRIEFDARTDSPSVDAHTPCLADDFEAGLGWNALKGTLALTPGAGPDGSQALSGTASTDNIFTAPGLIGVTSATVSADYFVMFANGDFDVLFTKPPYTGSFGTITGYVAGVFPVGGDTPMDVLEVFDAGAQTFLASRANTFMVQTWHHIDVTLALDGSMSIVLDGAPYLSSAPDSTLAPPYDVYVRFFAVGRLDNVRVDCTR